MTYDPALSTDKDKVRLLLGDTGATSQFQDTEITAMLNIYGSVYATAAALADALAARYAGQTNLSIDGFSVSGGSQAASYAALAARLRAQASSSAAGGLGSPLVGGISQSVMDGIAQDSDRVQPAFRRGQFDDPQTG